MMPDSDLLTKAWKIINGRRGVLIDQKIGADRACLHFNYEQELESLQEFADEYLDAVAPIDTTELERLEGIIKQSMKAIDYIKNSMPEVSIAGLTVVDVAQVADSEAGKGASQ